MQIRRVELAAERANTVDRQVERRRHVAHQRRGIREIHRDQLQLQAGGGK